MNSYKWAANDLKLAFAKKDAEFKKQLNPSFVVNEESIKECYIRRGGLVIDEDSIEIGTPIAPAHAEAKTTVETRQVAGGMTAKRIIRRK